MKKTRVFWGAAVVFALLLSGCLSSRQAISIIGYRNQHVYLKKDLSYKVGSLPDTWDYLSSRAKAVVFYNAGLRSSISTDAFCGSAFEDAPLHVLTSQIIAGQNDQQVTKTEEFMLDERGARRTILNAKTDGVPLKLDVVVMKKNNCTIDFVYVSPPENYAQGVADFENFFGGFKF